MSILNNAINPAGLMFSNISRNIVHCVGDKVYVRLPETYTIRGELVPMDNQPNALKLTAISKYCGEVDSAHIALPVHIPSKANAQELDDIRNVYANVIATAATQVNEYVEAFRF